MYFLAPAFFAFSYIPLARASCNGCGPSWETYIIIFVTVFGSIVIFGSCLCHFCCKRNHARDSNLSYVRNEHAETAQASQTILSDPVHPQPPPYVYMAYRRPLQSNIPAPDLVLPELASPPLAIPPSPPSPASQTNIPQTPPPSYAVT